MATATSFVRGTVIQRSAVQRCAPPAHFVLCDPQTELTLLKLTLRAEDAAATGWRRARVWLWGVWCDRSADAVALGDVVTVRGAELERDEAARATAAERLLRAARAPAPRSSRLRRASRAH